MSHASPPGRVDRRKTEFRDKITRAALKLFAQNGVGETSVASIIKEADIAHKTFFNHFPSKDHLLQHIVNSHSEYAYSFFREAFTRHTDPRKQIEYCLMSIANALNKFDSKHYRDLITFYFVSSASTQEFRKTQKENFTALINQILQDAKKQNLLKPGFTPGMLSEIVIDICVGTLINWSVEEDFPIIPKMKNAVKFINESVFIERLT